MFADIEPAHRSFSEPCVEIDVRHASFYQGLDRSSANSSKCGHNETSSWAGGAWGRCRLLHWSLVGWLRPLCLPEPRYSRRLLPACGGYGAGCGVAWKG